MPAGRQRPGLSATAAWCVPHEGLRQLPRSCSCLSNGVHPLYQQDCCMYASHPALVTPTCHAAPPLPCSGGRRGSCLSAAGGPELQPRRPSAALRPGGIRGQRDPWCNQRGSGEGQGVHWRKHGSRCSKRRLEAMSSSSRLHANHLPASAPPLPFAVLHICEHRPRPQPHDTGAWPGCSAGPASNTLHLASPAPPGCCTAVGHHTHLRPSLHASMLTFLPLL